MRIPEIENSRYALLLRGLKPTYIIHCEGILPRQGYCDKVERHDIGEELEKGLRAI